MKLRWMACGFAIGVASAIGTQQVLSQSGEDRGQHQNQMQGMSPQAQKLMAEMRKAHQNPQQPSVFHEKLKESVGTWDLDVRMYMAGPDGPAMRSSGTSEIKSVLNGRYVLEKMKMEFSMPDGEGGMQEVPYEGMGLRGYDNFRNQHVGVWADNMNTQMIRYSGAPSPDPDRLVMYGEMDEPMMNMIGRKVKYVTEKISDDKAIFTAYDLAAGENHKVMEITYTRQD